MGGRRVVVVETGWLAQHPPWTGNRWDLTPSTQITAKKASACSSDRFKMTTTVYSNKGRVQGWGNEGKIERLQSNTGKINSKLALSKEYYPVWHLGLNWNLFLHCLWKGVKCHVKEIGACWYIFSDHGWHLRAVKMHCHLLRCTIVRKK